MALSSKQSVALLLAVLAAAAASPASAANGGAEGCARPRKITIQNLCDHDLALTLQPLADSVRLFPDGYVQRRGTHSEFSVCHWTGRVSAPGAPMAEFHVGPEGGAWYQAPTAAANMLPMTVTPHSPHGSGLQGHCPAVGCRRGGQCFAHSVPGGNCSNVDEVKIIYCST